VILDDIHVGDEPSLLVLGHLAEQITDAKLLASWTKASDSHSGTPAPLCTTWRPASSALSRSTMWSH
jgi:hypothetical protein